MHNYFYTTCSFGICTTLTPIEGYNHSTTTCKQIKLPQTNCCNGVNNLWSFDQQFCNALPRTERAVFADQQTSHCIAFVHLQLALSALYSPTEQPIMRNISVETPLTELDSLRQLPGRSVLASMLYQYVFQSTCRRMRVEIVRAIPEQRAATATLSIIHRQPSSIINIRNLPIPPICPFTKDTNALRVMHCPLQITLLANHQLYNLNCTNCKTFAKVIKLLIQVHAMHQDNQHALQACNRGQETGVMARKGPG